MGLGKNRTRLGEYIDRHKITQSDLATASGKSRHTITDLCDGGKSIQANEDTQIRIVGALRRMGYDVRPEDFWT